MLSFATVLVLMLIVYVALFDADSLIEKILFAAIVTGAIGVMAVVHFAATPTRRLPHPEKVRREQRHIAMLTGVLGAVLLLLLYTAAFDLNSWSEWIVFGAISFAAIGTGIAVQARMR
jgi:accessory gene regulator protein AgrB